MVYEDATITKLRPLLVQDSWFGACAPAFQDALLTYGKVRRLVDGEALYSRMTQPEQSLFCVLEGALCIGSTDTNGLASMLVYLEPFHWFGELPLIDGQPRTHDAVADGTTCVLCVPEDRLIRWLESHPENWRDLARLCAYKLRVAYKVLGEPGTLLQLVARRLWLAAHGFGSRTEDPRTILRLSQEQLAFMLGVSRPSVHKALRMLELEGIIKQHYRKIEVIDLAGLAASARYLT